MMFPIAKYDNGKEGIRYAWSLDGKAAPPFVESGAFSRRTVRGGQDDDRIAAYTTSVSQGCVLGGPMNMACSFCVTGNIIGYLGPLSAKQIALQNVYMALDDTHATKNHHAREFAYMGQGEPGFAYNPVKDAILGTDRIMRTTDIPVYRHIFATAGVPDTIRQLGRDIANKTYGEDNSHILLHLSIHSVMQRDHIMPINSRYPLASILDAANDYSSMTGQKSVIAFMLFKDATLKGKSGINTSTVQEVSALAKMLTPNNQRVIFFDYNPDDRIGTNSELLAEDLTPLEQLLDAEGIEHKTFIAFGRKDGLACGLLGGCATTDPGYAAGAKELMDKSAALIDTHMYGR